MSAEVFLDTNVLLYACSGSPEDAAKRKVATDLILKTDFGLSAQVLQEFIANALRKPAMGISESEVDATLELATHVPVQPIDLEVILQAVTLRRRFQVSHWNATIVAAALSLGCTTLYSEDLPHGQKIETVQISNPFLLSDGIS